MRVLAVAALLVSTTALADPPSSCRELAAPKLATLPQAIQAKLSGGAGWEIEPKFAKLEVTIAIARGPQLVREILMACPGALDIIDVASGDARHFTSTVRMHVRSFATIARMIQMPSVYYLSIFDPTVPRPAIPEPIRHFH